MEAEPWRGARALAFAQRVTEALGLPRAQSAIVPILLGTPERALAAAAQLQEAGLLAVAAPAVTSWAEQAPFVAYTLERKLEGLRKSLAVVRQVSERVEQATTGPASPPTVEGTPWTGASSKEALVEADPAQMRQVLWNLLRNAVQASTAGEEVVVRLDTTGQRIALAPRDGVLLAWLLLGLLGLSLALQTRMLADPRRTTAAAPWSIDPPAPDEAAIDACLAALADPSAAIWAAAWAWALPWCRALRFCSAWPG